MKIRKITKRTFVQHARVSNEEVEKPIEIEDDKEIICCFMKSTKSSQKTEITVWSFIFLTHIFNLYKIKK